MVQLQFRRPAFFLWCLVFILVALACARSSQPSAPAPTTTPAPASAPAPAPTVSPAPSAAPAPASVPTAAGKPVDGQPLVPGGPPFYPSKLAGLTAFKLLEQYGQTKLPLWTKAQYGGEYRGAWGPFWVANTYLNYLKVQQASRPNYGGALLMTDYGLCSMVGRMDHLGTCNGKYGISNAIYLLPAIFEKWEQPDPVTYIFTVRKGVMWPAVPPMVRTDREVTSADITWFMEITKKEGVLRDLFALTQSFDAVDKYTVRVKMQSPHAEFLRHLSHNSMAIFPKECYEEKDCLGSKLISPGPFLFRDKESADRIKGVFDRNPEFYLKGLPYVDRWILVNIADVSAQKAAFITGQVDILSGGTPSEVELMFKRVPNMYAMAQAILAGASVLRPKLDGPMADLRVRRALALTMDLTTGWEVAYEGMQLFPNMVSRDFFGADFYYTQDQAGQWYQFNPEKAKQLMVEAGYPNGFSIQLQTSATSGAGYDMFLFLQSQWKKYLGVNLELKILDAASATTSLTEKKWQGFITGSFNPSFWASAEQAMLNLAKGQILNYQDVDDPVITDLYLRQRGELDPAKRAALLWQFEQRELDQVWTLRYAMVFSIVIKQGWELNHFAHQLTYFTISPLTAMIDSSRVPKR